MTRPLTIVGSHSCVCHLLPTSTLSPCCTTATAHVARAAGGGRAGGSGHAGRSAGPRRRRFVFFNNSNYCCGPFLCVFIRDMEVFSHPTNLSELILEIFLSWDGRREYSLFFLFSFEKRDMQAMIILL